MEPARTIIARFGGPSKVARLVGIHRTRVYGWMKPRAVGGTGGRVPQSHHLTLLSEAHKRGIALEPADFLAPPSTKGPEAA